MIVPTDFLRAFIIAELILVAAIVLITFLLKFIYYIKAAVDQQIKEEIKWYVFELLDKKKPFDRSKFFWRWKRLSLLMATFIDLDKKITNQAWFHLKHEIQIGILLPLARVKARSRNRANRLMAATCFELAMEQEDERQVCVLLTDVIPITQQHAVVAAIKWGSAMTINAVIDCMSNHRRFGQTIYLHAFEMADPKICSIISNRMLHEVNPFIVTICYKILMLFPPYSISRDMKTDFSSENIELRLAAIRYEVYCKGNEAVPLLIKMLSCEVWEIRSTCCTLLGNLRAKEALEPLSICLRDSAWWVRVNAANALKSIGAEGIKILESLDPIDDRYAYETAQFFGQSNFIG